LNTLEKRVQRTIDYLDSKKGKKNWAINVVRDYTDDMNIIAAIQTATNLIKYENIIKVLKAVRLRALGNFVVCMNGH
jgi:hypothetical protein